MPSHDNSYEGSACSVPMRRSVSRRITTVSTTKSVLLPPVLHLIALPGRHEGLFLHIFKSFFLALPTYLDDLSVRIGGLRTKIGDGPLWVGGRRSKIKATHTKNSRKGRIEVRKEHFWWVEKSGEICPNLGERASSTQARQTRPPCRLAHRDPIVTFHDTSNSQLSKFPPYHTKHSSRIAPTRT